MIILFLKIDRKYYYFSYRLTQPDAMKQGIGPRPDWNAHIQPIKTAMLRYGIHSAKSLVVRRNLNIKCFKNIGFVILTINSTTMVARTRNIPLMMHDSKITGRRLNFAIINGVKHTTVKSIIPMDIFAHFASAVLKPADSNIITE